VIVVTVIAADQAAKQFVLQTLQPGKFVSLFGEHVGWQLLFNPGGAFGLRAPHWLFLLAAAIVSILVWRVLSQNPPGLAFLGFGFLLAGAYANIIDRLFRARDGFGSGEVVDFIAWGSFPRFNVADAAITVGVAFVLLSLVFVGSHDTGITTTSNGEPDSDGGM